MSSRFSPLTTIPMLTVAATGRPVDLPGNLGEGRAQALGERNGLLPLTSESTAANSSPPRRPIISVERRFARAASANTCNTRSPMACPKRSLIDLK